MTLKKMIKIFISFAIVTGINVVYVRDSLTPFCIIMKTIPPISTKQRTTDVSFEFESRIHG
jgi:hypothetical protein